MINTTANTNGYKYDVTDGNIIFHVDSHVYASAIINISILTPHGHVPVAHIDCMRPDYESMAEFSRNLSGKSSGILPTATGRVIASGDYVHIKVAGNITETTIARMPRVVLTKAFRWMSCYLFVMGAHAWMLHDRAAEEHNLIVESMEWFRCGSAEDSDEDSASDSDDVPPGFEQPLERFYGGYYTM